MHWNELEIKFRNSRYSKIPGISSFRTFQHVKHVKKSGNLGPILVIYMWSDEGGETLWKAPFFRSFMGQAKKDKGLYLERPDIPYKSTHNKWLRVKKLNLKQKIISFFFLLTLITAQYSFAQVRPELLLENLEESTLNIKCYCKPGIKNRSRSKGIELSYNLIGPGELAIPNGEINPPLPRYSKFRKIKAKLSYPIVRSDAFTMIMSYGFHAEQFKFNLIPGDHERLLTNLDNLNLKGSSLSAIMTYALGEKNYLGFRLNADYQGGYKGLINLGSEYAIYSTTLAFGIKKNEDNEWGFGLIGSSSFRQKNFRVLPFLFFNTNLNGSLGIEATLPVKIYLRHNIDPETIVLVGANYNGESYSFNQDIPDRQISFSHSEIQYLIKVQRQLVPWLWFNAEAGYQSNFNSNFQLQENGTNLLDIDPNSSYFFRIGVFISPPDKFTE